MLAASDFKFPARLLAAGVTFVLAAAIVVLSCEAKAGEESIPTAEFFQWVNLYWFMVAVIALLCLPLLRNRLPKFDKKAVVGVFIIAYAGIAGCGQISTLTASVWEKVSSDIFGSRALGFDFRGENPAQVWIWVKELSQLPGKPLTVCQASAIPLDICLSEMEAPPEELKEEDSAAYDQATKMMEEKFRQCESNWENAMAKKLWHCNSPVLAPPGKEDAERVKWFDTKSDDWEWHEIHVAGINHKRKLLIYEHYLLEISPVVVAKEVGNKRLVCVRGYLYETGEFLGGGCLDAHTGFFAPHRDHFPS